MRSKSLVAARASFVSQASESSPAERRAIKPDPLWRVIAGVHAESNGDLGVAWLGIGSGSITLFDSWVFKRTDSLPFVVDGIKLRGDWVPLVMARSHAEIAKKLMEKGCKVLRGRTGEIEGFAEDEALASWVSREINANLNAGAFIVLDTNQDWLKEYDHFMERDGVVPDAGSPLMSATRYAYHFRKFARQETPKFKKITYDRRGLV